MLLTRRMERMGLRPLGFVATDYVLGLWGLRPPTKAQLDQLFDEDMLGDDLEAWMDESTMLRRSFRNVAVIAGLIERRFPGEEKSRRQVTVQLRPDLRHAAPARTQPHPAARHAPGRGVATRGPQEAGRSVEAREGSHRLSPARPHLAARRAGAAGDRPRERAGRQRRGRALDIAAQELIDEATRL